MPKVITLDRIVVDDVRLYRRNILVDSGEVNPDDTSIMVSAKEWALTVSYSMFGTDIGHIGGSKTFRLDGQQQNQVRNFMRPFVASVKSEIDIQDGEEWAD